MRVGERFGGSRGTHAQPVKTAGTKVARKGHLKLGVVQKGDTAQLGLATSLSVPMRAQSMEKSGLPICQLCLCALSTAPTLRPDQEAAGQDPENPKGADELAECFKPEKAAVWKSGATKCAASCR